VLNNQTLLIMNALPQEYTKKQAIEYLKSKGKTSGRFYNNVYSWSSYLTLKPTFATPTGKAKGFARTIIVKAN
jgi:hypothetical protein